MAFSGEPAVELVAPPVRDGVAALVAPLLRALLLPRLHPTAATAKNMDHTVNFAKTERTRLDMGPPYHGQGFSRTRSTSIGVDKMAWPCRANHSGSSVVA